MEIAKNKTSDLKILLKKEGYKITPTRIKVLEIFFKIKKPIKAEDIYSQLKNNIDKATVYRILTLFEKGGLIRQVNLRRESVYFEINNDHHHHIVCVECGEIEDFKESNEIDKILGRIVEKSSRFKIINEHSLELFGVCNFCK